MQFIQVQKLSQEEQQGVWELLLAVDEEFVPPLSTRESTHQSDLTAVSNKETASGPITYFNELNKQFFILAKQDNRVVGFLSYRSDYVMEIPVDDTLKKTEYITTIAVQNKLRGKGVAGGMYAKLLANPSGKSVSTRTWSTNLSHLTLLSRLGFELIYRIPDDRGTGIDTVYYQKR